MTKSKLLGQDAYPVFVMYQLLKLNGILDSKEQTDDAIWEFAVLEYELFKRKTKYNNPSKSEYDCIAEYVKTLVVVPEEKEYMVALERNYFTTCFVKAKSKEDAYRIGYSMCLEREAHQSDLMETFYIDSEVYDS